MAFLFLAWWFAISGLLGLLFPFLFVIAFAGCGEHVGHCQGSFSDWGDAEDEREEGTEEKPEEEEEVVLSFENLGVSMQDMMAMITQGTGCGEGSSVCHFVNLCEDAHDDGLIYMIPPGTTKIKKYEDDDKEVCIKLDGESIQAVHAILESFESSGVTIQSATEGAVLWVQWASGIWLGEGQIGAWISCDFGHDFVFSGVLPEDFKAARGLHGILIPV